MTGEIYRFRRFAVVLDEEPDAEPLRYAMQCVVCQQFGPLVETSKERVGAEGKAEAAVAKRTAADWVRVHRLSHPDHYTYRCIEVSPYRMVPGEWVDDALSR